MSSTVVEVKGLVKRYGNRVAVNGVDLSILEGEIFGLLGPNGAGKTTTISILATLSIPDDGEVRICGHELRQEVKRIKPLIGFVPQELALYPTLSAWDNLTFFGRLQGLQGTLLKERVASTLSLGHSPFGLIAVSLAAAATSTGLGIMVAALARTEAQVGDLTVLLLLSLSALGGCFIPRFVMPQWLRMVGLITPHAWALDAYQDLLVRGYNFMEVLPKVGVLGAFAVIFFGVGVWRFRFE